MHLTCLVFHWCKMSSPFAFFWSDICKVFSCIFKRYIRCIKYMNRYLHVLFSWVSCYGGMWCIQRHVWAHNQMFRFCFSFVTMVVWMQKNRSMISNDFSSWRLLLKMFPLYGLEKNIMVMNCTYNFINFFIIILRSKIVSLLKWCFKTCI